MDGNIAKVTALVNDPSSREPDPVGQLISSFLIARSGTFRELAELREEVSELLTRLPQHTTLIYNTKVKLLIFIRDGATRKATSTSKSSGKSRMRRLIGSKEHFTT